jgi:hypothetical protein
MGTRRPGPLGIGAITAAKVQPPRARRKASASTELPILGRGARGAEVQKLQRQLNARLMPAPKLAVDGIFGPITQRAVLDYQKAMSIDADGIVGKLTWYHLIKGDKATVRKPEPVAVHAHAGAPTAAAPLAPLPATNPGVWEWPLEEKFAEALRRTAPKLDHSVRDEFKALLTPGALAVMAGTLVVWAASHAFGVGAVVDVLLLFTGIIFLGVAAFDVAEDLGDFILITSTASSDAELEQASSHLSRAIAVMGVAAFMALLAKVATKARAPISKGSDTAPHSRQASASGRQGAKPGNPNAEPPKGREPTGVRAPRKLSKEELAEWYKKQGDRFKDPKQLENHMEGTDFTKPVTLRELPENSEVIQYVRKDGQPGMYFARPGTPMSRLGIEGQRELQRFVVRKPIEVVESTAKTVALGKAPGVGGLGGGQQLMLPSGWENSVVRLPGGL